jgi:hypothetical protein
MPNLQCPRHSMFEPVAVARGVITVEGWSLESDGCPGQEASELQSCDPPPAVWISVDVSVCAGVSGWSVGPEDFTAKTVDGRSFAATSDGMSGDRFGRRLVRSGHCAEGSIGFDPIGNAVADAYNPPTIVFQQPGTPTVEWTNPAAPTP